MNEPYISLRWQQTNMITSSVHPCHTIRDWPPLRKYQYVKITLWPAFCIAINFRAAYKIKEKNKKKKWLNTGLHCLGEYRKVIRHDKVSPNVMRTFYHSCKFQIETNHISRANSGQTLNHYRDTRPESLNYNIWIIYFSMSCTVYTHN